MFAYAKARGNRKTVCSEYSSIWPRTINMMADRTTAMDLLLKVITKQTFRSTNVWALRTTIDKIDLTVLFQMDYPCRKLYYSPDPYCSTYPGGYTKKGLSNDGISASSVSVIWRYRRRRY